MATKTLEARFEHLSVKDENNASHSNGYYGKPKVYDMVDSLCHTCPLNSFNPGFPSTKRIEQ